jgi:hypothetical protein
MKIAIGEVFRVVHSVKGAGGADAGAHRSYIDLTRGEQSKGADVQKGIFAYMPVREPGTSLRRVPAVILHSNPFKGGSEWTPWVDIIEPDMGYAVYNGDNRRGTRPPLEARGNALLAHLQAFYDDPTLRRFAPPMLLFTQREVAGNRRGNREFSGYGIPVDYRLVSQREKKSDRYFTNLVVELVLFGLEAENERFDWTWIDRRRDPKVSAEEALKVAPSAWRTWVAKGITVLEGCRRRVARRQVAGIGEQSDYSEVDEQLLAMIVKHFAPQPHAFEGLASLVASRVIGQACKRGWITRRSADGGVDFVCRVDIGSEFSRVRVVVLGQAKCQRSVSGKDLARLVARLQRGWIGVFVTTGIFSRAAQEELHSDRYPVLLINGKRLAREVRLILNAEGITLVELLKREQLWYEANVQSVQPERILNEIMLGPHIESLSVHPTVPDQR